LKIRFLWSSAAAALVVSAALAGCGGTTYFAGRNLPPSGLTNRVMIAIQNPSAFKRRAAVCGRLLRYSQRIRAANLLPISISGYSGALPASIQNMPEEQTGYVYGSGDGSYTPVSYAKENTSGNGIRAERVLIQHLHHAQPEPTFSQPARAPMCLRWLTTPTMAATR
jgi:hypothetical protein